MRELEKLARRRKHVKGYVYFRESVDLAVKNEMALTAVMKEIYRPVADRYRTSVSCVERDIRYFCGLMWSHGGRDAMIGILGTEQKKTPSNRECIRIAAELLRAEKDRRPGAAAQAGAGQEEP